MTLVQTFRPDSKGRVCFGSWAKDVSSYRAIYDDVTGNIILEPYKEIPARELWLFENEEALRSVVRGMRQSELGMVKDRGSFFQYVDKADEED